MAGDVKERPDGWARPSRGIARGEVRGDSPVDELARDIETQSESIGRKRDGAVSIQRT